RRLRAWSRVRRRLWARLWARTRAATSSLTEARSALRASGESRPSSTAARRQILRFTSWSDMSTPAELSTASVLIRPPASAYSMRARLVGRGDVGTDAAVPEEVDVEREHRLHQALAAHRRVAQAEHRPRLGRERDALRRARQHGAAGREHGRVVGVPAQTRAEEP